MTTKAGVKTCAGCGNTSETLTTVADLELCEKCAAPHRGPALAGAAKAWGIANGEKSE